MCLDCVTTLKEKLASWESLTFQDIEAPCALMYIRGCIMRERMGTGGD